jgi:type IX secretion system PorP/SprF family membrane protein
MKKIVAILLLLFIVVRANSQDAQMTQYFSSPLYLAPSFAGSSLGSRAVLNFRDQWPAIPGAFITYMFSLDHNFYKYHSGVGLLFLRDQAGSGRLALTQVSLNYSYNIVFSRFLNVRPALSVLFSQRSIDYSRLVFGDQISLDHGYTPTVEDRLLPSHQYLDFNFSTVALYKNFWGGFNLMHLLQPDQSLINEGISPVPTDFYLFGGGKFKAGPSSSAFKNKNILFSFLYKAQGKFDQLDMGVYWEDLPFVVGLWYRGLPVKQYAPAYPNHDAIVVVLGYANDKFKVGYSYDFTVSKLAFKSGGAHEISFAYEFNQNQRLKKSKKKQMIPCAKF